MRLGSSRDMEVDVDDVLVLRKMYYDVRSFKVL